MVSVGNVEIISNIVMGFPKLFEGGHLLFVQEIGGQLFLILFLIQHILDPHDLGPGGRLFTLRCHEILVVVSARGSRVAVAVAAVSGAVLRLRHIVSHWKTARFSQDIVLNDGRVLLRAVRVVVVDRVTVVSVVAVLRASGVCLCGPRLPGPPPLPLHRGVHCRLIVSVVAAHIVIVIVLSLLIYYVREIAHHNQRRFFKEKVPQHTKTNL